ncbi:DNA polymerase III subunit gamma/tau [Treponema sp. OMZ 838]|uniref:DNA polymerase III subunit gamma/tau n=1 Tax=Treponema sp. OMZ 838 TaxID=1539298 RepID=UPI0005301435|nr:DNA polymerase III subunit gamma/tau [Treponema sp. OMZ 838]AIW90403.1 DNA polymerase III subunit gamma/tau [Treponema sp. OMZ 838]
MFENVLGQPVIQLLSDELEQRKVPPALLFAGPESSGKLTAALETARVLSCVTDGSWTCTCESCKRHKDLSASDLLILGTRDTVLETKAAAHALCTAKTMAARYLFVRAVRKLTSRFDSRLWDTDESRFVKAAPILTDIEEALSDLIGQYGNMETISEEEAKKLEKQTEKITDLCQKLQEDCMYDTLPVNQVRKASAWVRLMPVGKKKVLIIENADKMQESARNAFLKILEEPPEYTVFILTTTRRAAVIPTILSRVRTYLFIERDTEHQQAVVERVFRDHHFCTAVSPSQPIRIVSYLQSFLPVAPEYFREAATVFWEYCLNRGEQQKKQFTVLIQKLTAYRTEHPSTYEPSITAVLKLLNNCKPRRIYILFLEAIIVFLQESIHTGVCTPYELERYAAVSQFIHTAMQSVDIFNGTPQAALETLSEQIAFA